jgi:hypothetical protein
MLQTINIILNNYLEISEHFKKKEESRQNTSQALV